MLEISNSPNLQYFNVLQQCEGCAYRGRVLIELVTKIEEEGVESPPPSQPIEDDVIDASQVQ